MVIPLQHFEDFIDLPDDLAAHIFLVAKKISKAMRIACRPSAVSHLSDDDVSKNGYNLVAHYKFHLIPRFENDKVVIEWNRDADPGVDTRILYANQIKKELAP